MTEKPVERKVFEVPKQFLEHLSSMKKEDKGLVDEIETLCKRVGELVAELGISGECTGFVADGDLAVPWKDYFDRREGEKSVSYFRFPFAETTFNGNCRALLNFCPGPSSRPQVWASNTHTPP